MTKLILFALSMLLAVSSAFAQKHPEYLWGKSIGGTDIAIDNNGHIYTVRNFRDTIIQGGQTFITSYLTDGILTKTTTDGDIIWQRQIGGKSTDYIARVKCDNAGNAYILGDFNNTIIIGNDTLNGRGSRSVFVAKFNDTGTALWAKAIDHLGDHVWNSIAVDNSGNVYVGVHASLLPNDTLHIGNNYFRGRGSNDIFIAKYNSNGQAVWALQEGGPGRDGILSITTDDAGGFYTTGYFDDSAYFGTTLLPDASERNIFLAKYDSSGTLQFVTTPQKGKGTGFDLAVDKSGNIYQCGKIDGNTIFGGTSLFVSTTSSFLTKYDHTGNVIWAKNYPYNQYHHAFRMYLDHNNDIYVNMASGVASIVKYNDNGDILWSNEFGPQQKAPSVLGLCGDINGNLYFTGTCEYQNNVFGTDTIAISSKGFSEFIAKAGAFPSGISKQATITHDITLYPNPNRGSFTLQGSSLKNYTTYNIVSVTGQSVAKGKLSATGKVYQINAGTLAKGIYILTLNGSDRKSSLTFTIE